MRYALFEADDAAVGQAMNVNMGPEKPADLDAMWQEIRAGEFPAYVAPRYLPDGIRSASGAQAETCGVALHAGAVSTQR